MSAVRVAVAAGLVAVCAGAIVWSALQPADPASGVPTNTVALIDLSTSETCRECHEGVFAEWEASYHAQSYLDPLVRAPEQADNFRKQECLPCHTPAPILEKPIGKGARVYERFAFREQGVDCLSCHKIGNHVAGSVTLDGSVAPCQPIADERVSSMALCAPCHNQHDTVNQWEASKFFAEGVDCNDCHMPEVTRTLADGSTKVGRSHQFIGSHDRDSLKSSATVRHEVSTSDDGQPVLLVHITNDGAGHNFPTDARHRALDLVVTLVQHDGIDVPPREARPLGRDRGTARRRFRNPYRQEEERVENLRKYGRENTQIHAGETVTFEVPYRTDRVAKARVELIYKLTPIMTDSEGVSLFDEVVDL